MSEAELTDKVAFLSTRTAYPVPTTSVETKETHMSCLFLTDHHVWKLKKPVRYAYLDFSTVEARKRDCELELELNRRLAPDVYLGIMPLVTDAEGKMQLGGEGRVVDWLVMMRRLPEHRMLDVAIADQTVTREEIRNVGVLLTRFYQQAKKMPLSAAEYKRLLEAEAAECARELRRPEFGLPPETVESIEALQIATLKQHAGVFDERARQGKIVEAHGDLRPEHICLESQPVIIDCLEFHPDFRILDPVSELAFLALECERLGAAWVGDLILETYRHETNDCPPELLARYYKRQHAYVRAKIAIWHLKDHDVRDPGKWIEKAKDYLRRAQSFQQFHN
jgi:aminoglycoside phosphotransferase family enzyme